MGGYIKVRRDILDHPVICKDNDRLAVMLYLMKNAAYAEHEVFFCGKKVKLMPGQLIIGRKKLADETHISESKAERILKCFKTEHLIEQQSDNHGRLITLLFEESDSESEQQIEQQSDSNRTASEQPVNTTKESNKGILEEGKNELSISNEIHRPSGKARQEKDEAVRLWNQLPDPVVKIKGVSAGSKRDRLLTKRLADYGLDEYRKAIENISHSEFLQTGKFFSFDWFIRPENFVKVLEGNYNDKDTRAAPEPTGNGYSDEDYARIAAVKGEAI